MYYTFSFKFSALQGIIILKQEKHAETVFGQLFTAFVIYTYYGPSLHKVMPGSNYTMFLSDKVSLCQIK